MYMDKNPFVSNAYVKTWSKHFNDSKPVLSFNFIKNISFFRKDGFPVYINTGNNLTSGITYKIIEDNEIDYKGKVFLIKDIPSYYNL